MSSVTLNGNTYQDSDFGGYGYVSRFPAQIFSDFIAEMNTRLTVAIAVAGLTGAIQTKTGVYNLASDDAVVFMDCSGGDGTVNLFALATLPANAKMITIVLLNSDTAKVTLVPNGAETINGNAGSVDRLSMRNEVVRLVKQSATNWQEI